MDGLERIIPRITADVQAEIEAIETEAAVQSEEIRQKYQEAAHKEQAVLLERGRNAAAERVYRLSGVAALEAKKEILAAKQELIAQVFAKAEQTLCRLPAQEYVYLLATLAAGAAQSGQEQIILSPQDRARYGTSVIKAANSRRQNGAFTLAEKSREIKGGLLLSQGDVEINCSFESLIQQLRAELTPQVVRLLFAAP